LQGAEPLQGFTNEEAWLCVEATMELIGIWFRPASAKVASVKVTKVAIRMFFTEVLLGHGRPEI
jgi:hypothetical protein